MKFIPCGVASLSSNVGQIEVYCFKRDEAQLLESEAQGCPVGHKVEERIIQQAGEGKAEGRGGNSLI